MKTFRKHRLVFSSAVLVASAAVVLAGCSSGTSTSSGGGSASSGKSIIVGITPDAQSAVLVAAVKQGMFKQNGINATIKMFSDSNGAISAISTGQADLAAAGQYGAVSALASGAKVKIISSNSTSAKQFGIVSKDSITKPADLVGKSIGIAAGNTSGYYFALYEKKYGLSGVTIKNIGAQQLIPALAGNQIDAFASWQPTVDLGAQTVPNAHVLNYGGDDNVMVGRSFIDSSQKVYGDNTLGAAIVKSLGEAATWANANQDALAQILATQFQQPTATWKTNVAQFSYGVNLNDASLQELTRVANFLVSSKTTGAINVQDFVNSEPMKMVNPSMVGTWPSS